MFTGFDGLTGDQPAVRPAINRRSDRREYGGQTGSGNRRGRSTLRVLRFVFTGFGGLTGGQTGDQPAVRPAASGGQTGGSTAVRLAAATGAAGVLGSSTDRYRNKHKSKE